VTTAKSPYSYKAFPCALCVMATRLNLCFISAVCAGYNSTTATAAGSLSKQTPRGGSQWAGHLSLRNNRSVALETEGLGPQPFHGRVVLLCNEHSSGTAKMVAQFAKENQVATIVGTHTPWTVDRPHWFFHRPRLPVGGTCGCVEKLARTTNRRKCNRA
jgi:hypothetical protein